MQDATITLEVNENGDGTTMVSNPYTRKILGANNTTYYGANNSFLMRDQIKFFRSFPTANADFNGVAKGSMKTTKDVEVLNKLGETIVAPIIIETKVSTPVGVADADFTDAYETHLALVSSTAGRDNAEDLSI